MAAELKVLKTDQKPDRVHDARAAKGANADKASRLRLLKARHENYLAERREEQDENQDVTSELS